jgi:hypothetical protein
MKRTLLGLVLVTAATSCSSEEAAPAPPPAAATTPRAARSDEEDRARVERLAARLAPAFDQLERSFEAEGALAADPLLEAAGRAPLVAYCGIEEGEGLAPGRLARVLDGAPDLTQSVPAHRLEGGVYRTPAAEPAVRGTGIVLWRELERRAPGRIAWACLFVPDERVDELLGAR